MALIATSGVFVNNRYTAGMKLFNTLTRQKEEFKPIVEGQVGMYSCGPTVYNFVHLGNLRTYIMSDVLKRVLRMNGYEVKHIMNITDVGHLTIEETDSGEDKMERSAAEQGKTVQEVADYYTAAFLDNVRQLGIIPPNNYVKATEHIPQQIAMIKQLMKLGYAYETDEEVYFDTSKLSDYGRLAQLDVAGQQAGARVDVGQKRNPTDFALWKKLVGENAKHAQHWPSPWGEGFPGWHIECSAMSVEYLGQPFDIHTGATDLIPVHHTNEIAQAEAANGKPLANFWVHGAFLVLGKPGEEERMGKSLGNFQTLQDVIDRGIDPLAYRYLTYTTHYRQLLYFSSDSLDGAATALGRLRRVYQDLPDAGEHGVVEVEAEIKAALSDDLDVPRAVALVWEMVRSGKYHPAEVKATLHWFSDLLELDLGNMEVIDVPAQVQLLVEEREQARIDKDWEKADALRARIEEMGFTVNDTDAGAKIGRL